MLGGLKCYCAILFASGPDLFSSGKVQPFARCVFTRDSIRTTDISPAPSQGERALAETTRWRAVVRVLRSPIDSLSCALLPSSCNLCGSPLPALSSVPICPACWSEFPLQTGPVCACCGDALNAAATPANADLCRPCRLAPPAFVRAVSYGVYQGRMREAIHALKYDRLHPAAKVLGGMLAQAIATLAPDAPREMLVIPIPLHRSKYVQRGFNQSRSLAAHALHFLRTAHPEWRLTLAPSTLMRLRATDSQAGLTTRQRRQNVRGAFSVSDPARVAAKHILLVDDILTTGATARAAAQTLRQAGAASVWVATLARAQRAVAWPSANQTSEESEWNERAGQEHESFTGAQANAAQSRSSNEWAQPSF